MTSTSSPQPPSPSSAEANVATARKAIDAFNRGDVEAMRALGGDVFEYDWSRSRGPNSGVYRGMEGFMEFVRDQWTTFDEVKLEAHEFIPRGDHVVVPSTVHARGREGIPVSANSTHLYTFEAGRLVRITLYQEREEALRAAL
jgi:ketosteroid isomerase-like protein